ncbi:MAG: PASTA domain-containing protein, partial [Actinomycetota bacterium]
IAAIGVLAGLFLFTRAIVGPGTVDVVVPSVLELPLTQATGILEERGLVVSDALVEVEDDTRDPGTVVAQDPGAGATVAEGTEVVLTVVVLPESALVPDVSGLSEAAAKIVLGQAGFQVLVANEASETVDVGLATRTDPAVGAAQPYGSTITLYVSSGIGTVIVPDVRCQSFGTASSTLRDAGLNPTISETAAETNPLCPNPNRVAVQDPAPGTEVTAGTTVVLSGGGAEPSPSPSPTLPPIPSPTFSPTPSPTP